jgi:hypothetical protein
MRQVLLFSSWRRKKAAGANDQLAEMTMVSISYPVRDVVRGTDADVDCIEAVCAATLQPTLLSFLELP